MAAESQPNVTNSLSDNNKYVKGPNLLERAKDEFEACSCTTSQESPPNHRDKTLWAKSKNEQQTSYFSSGLSLLLLSLVTILWMLVHIISKKKYICPLVRAKEEIKAIIHHDKSPHHHHRETHSRSDDIDENTPICEVKGPNAFERIKDEFEAVIKAIHPKKEK